MELKDVLKLTLVNSRKEVKNLTNKQVDRLVEKLSKLYEIAQTESNNRYTAKLKEEAEAELENEEDENVSNEQ